MATFAFFAVAPLTPAAEAGEVHFDPDSPAGKEYALPLPEARNEAQGESENGKTDPTPPLYGVGITSGGSGGGGGAGGENNGGGAAPAGEGSRDGSSSSPSSSPAGRDGKTSPHPQEALQLSSDKSEYPLSNGLGILIAILLLGLILGLILRRASAGLESPIPRP